MVVLRATQKLAKVLPPSADAAAESDTALGDWYVNRLIVDRQPLLLLVSARSLLAIVTQPPFHSWKPSSKRIPATRLGQLTASYSLTRPRPAFSPAAGMLPNPAFAAGGGTSLRLADRFT